MCTARTGQDLAARFAVMCRLSDDPQGIARHIKAPSECQDYAKLLPRVLDQVDASEAPAWLELMERCDALRKPDRFLALVSAAQCVKEVDLRAWQARVGTLRSIDAGAIAKAEQGRPERIKAALHEARLAALRAAPSGGDSP